MSSSGPATWLLQSSTGGGTSTAGRSVVRGRWRREEERARFALAGPTLAGRVDRGEICIEGMRGASGALGARRKLGDLSDDSERPADTSYTSVSSRRRPSLSTDSSSLACTLSTRSSSEVQKEAASIVCMLKRVQHAQVASRIFSLNSLAISRRALRLQWMKVPRMPHSEEQRTSSLSEAGDADSSTPRQATTCELTLSISRLIISPNSQEHGRSDCKVLSMASHCT
mmetsp:Transcript_9682/g.24077  ORF Transcript_9682/g.24077 Transcript_9682/m.24077 type:complete len:227 (-) Transcript_9682:116-796(-)